MANISLRTQQLIGQYKNWYEYAQKKEGKATIHADEVASKVAAFYEKIRGIIDWREEHLLRRGAIERILKRRLFLRGGQKIEALPLVLELIRSGHFPNDQIEELKTENVQNALNKYIFIVENSPKPQTEKNRIQLQDWLFSVAACEVEEILDPPRKERIIIDYMTNAMKERIKLENGLTEEEKNIQIYIAVQRALFKLDNAIIFYHMIKQQIPQWRQLPKIGTDTELENIAKNIYSIWENLEKKLHHPLSERFYRVCEKYDTPYLLLGDVLSQDPMKNEEKLENPESLEVEIKNAYQLRLKQQKSRVSRAAFYSVLSIFLSKIAIVFLLEYQIDTRLLHQFNLQTLALSVIIPPILMLFFIVGIKPPGKGNLEKVILEVMKIIYEGEKKDAYPIRTRHRSNRVISAIIFIIYSATFLLTFGAIWLILGKLNFSWPSKIIFVLFFSLISFAGTKIKERTKELSIEEEKGGILSFIIDWFSLPFIRLGRWLSGQWAKYNIVMVIFIALIDLPFQVFIEFLEQWRYFVIEKKKEIH